MRGLVTGDGSITYYNTKFAEYYHSKSGAVEESVKKFLEPCKLNEGAKILDIGFGLGYNVAAALDKLEKVYIESLEYDTGVFSLIKHLNPPFKSYSLIKRVLDAPVIGGRISIKQDEQMFNLMIGDATKTICKLETRYDAVFLDAFSPKKNPELWTKSFLLEIYSRMKVGGILATYSCARVVRDNLKEVGFMVSDGPIVGRRSPGTVAVK